MTKKYTTFLPILTGGGAPTPQPEPPPWHKRGVAGFTWSKIAPQYRWSGSRISWGHSWSLRTGEAEGVECVPMIWGLTRPAYPNYGLDYAIKHLPEDYDGHLLVLNEPADEAQADLSPELGVYLWMQVCERWRDAKLIGPQMLSAMQGTAYNARARDWFARFWSKMPKQGRDRVTAHSYHIYINDVSGHTAAARDWMDWCDAFSGSRPYWVTEWGVNGSWHGDGGEVAVKSIAAWYDTEPRVARHAYFIPYISSGAGWADYRMFGDDGLPNGIGRGWLF